MCRFKFFLSVFIFLAFISTAGASAQEYSDSVEIDLEVLDAFEQQLLTAPKAQPRMDKKHIAKANLRRPQEKADLPPLPPKRPKILNAPLSFIAEARQNFNDIQPAAGEEQQDAAGDMITSDELKRPDARQVLASIENENGAGAPSPPYRPDKAGAGKLPPKGLISFGYRNGATELPDDFKPRLGAEIQLKRKLYPDSRLEIHAFAAADETAQNKDRRVSLARGTNVRDFLIAYGIHPQNIDLRPLGSRTDLEPIDRIDIWFVSE